MTIRRCTLLVALFAGLYLSMDAVATDVPSTLAGDWKAGVAKVKITPTKPLRMGGYASRKRPADGTLTDLWAKALVLEDVSGTRAMLITIDVNNISRDLSTAVCRELHTQFSLKRRSIALNASHTHSGPAMGARAYYTFTDQEHQDLKDYTTDLRRKLIAVAGEALNHLAPARLRAEGKLRGPVDHDVPVLLVQNKSDRFKAVVCGYACHATTLNGYQISADWPVYAQSELEKKYPGAIALIWIGCGGDQNPVPRRKVEYAQDYGRQLADAVEKAQSDQAQPIAGQLVCSYAEIDMPFARIPTRQELRQTLDSRNRFEVARAKTLLQRLERNGKLDSTYPYRVQVWKLGDGPTFVLFGGEVVVDYSLRLKQAVTNPFGETGETVKMNPGRQNPGAAEPAGPVDDQVFVVALRHRDSSQSLAVLANYGLHYVGGIPRGQVSADYFGVFADQIQQNWKADRLNPPFVGMMTNGTSGDVNAIDFTKPRQRFALFERMTRIGRDLADGAARVIESMEFHFVVKLAAASAELELRVRKPEAERLVWAAQTLPDSPHRLSRSQIYAREARALAEFPDTVAVPIQAFRIGDLAIAQSPCETFAETGLKIKDASPFPAATFTIELANGYNGSLPSKEQHALGGYETWPTRSSYLEVDAEQKIREGLMKLLEHMMNQSMRRPRL